jgi:hypothetical protein
MSDVIFVLNALGITPYIIGVTVAFGAIALYFGFTKRS